MRRLPAILRFTSVLVTTFVLLATPAAADRSSDVLRDLFRDVTPNVVPTGILYDRVVGLSGIGDYDGRGDPPVSLALWRQLYSEIRRAAIAAPTWPPLAEINDDARRSEHSGEIPIAIMNFRYNRIRPDAIASRGIVISDGRIVELHESALTTERVFAAAPLVDHTYRGGRVTFTLDPKHYASNEGSPPPDIMLDFSDGRGWRSVAFGVPQTVRFTSAGIKTIGLRARFADGSELLSAFRFDVRNLMIPMPDDTLEIVATIPYEGGFGTGDAYVYLADAHATITDPIVVVEGFDLDNSMSWDELYTLLNREELLETARGLGFDIIVLNFTDATEYIQRNAFAAVELIDQINAILEPDADLAIIGASMGGLVGRYALTYMESQAMAHNTRLFISFDSPQSGANIPLGMQYWLAFFADLSVDAAAWLEALDSPAARQMLAYHHTDFSDTTATSDPLRADFLSDIAALGQYPASPRMVSIINGSSTQLDQGYAAGAQVIEWEYDTFLIDIIGNIWSVPDAGSQVIMHGLIAILGFPTDEAIVTVSGSDPYDSAPGGNRNSMEQIADSEAPYGDIIALHPRHCFIPTISALDLDTSDLFYDVAGDPDILAHTPFDEVYTPIENQEHSAITPENKEWFLFEVNYGTTAVSGTPSTTPVVLTGFPNPFSSSAKLRLDLPHTMSIRLGVYDIGGRKVASLADEPFDAGTALVAWDGRNDAGDRVAPGVYFVRLEGDGSSLGRKLVLR